MTQNGNGQAALLRTFGNVLVGLIPLAIVGLFGFVVTIAQRTSSAERAVVALEGKVADLESGASIKMAPEPRRAFDSYRDRMDDLGRRVERLEARR